MKIVAFDSETELFAPGRQIPPLVCVQTKQPNGEVKLMDHTLGLEWMVGAMEAALASTDDAPLVLSGHNVPYDFAVLAEEARTQNKALGERVLKLIYDVYVRGRVWDSRVAEWLMDTADGCLYLEPWATAPGGFRRAQKGWYGLARLAKKYAGMELDKEGAARTTYGPLRGVPIEQWPEGHVQYAREDAIAQYAVTMGQLERARTDPRGVLQDLPAEVRAYWALHLASAWGMVTDLNEVSRYELHLRSELQSRLFELKALGLVEQVGGKGKKAGTWKKNKKRLAQLVAEAYKVEGKPVPMTAPSAKFPDGQIATDADTIEQCQDARLGVWRSYSHDEKMLSTYVPTLKGGIVHPRYDFAGTGRTTAFDPNIQNLPRAPGVRECYIPREGFLLCSVDYGAQELVTFAQVLLEVVGHSKLADALNADIDPHLLFAAEQLMHIDYDEAKRKLKVDHDPVVKENRQLAKPVNFGLPGGMGASRLVEYMRVSAGIYIEEKEAYRLKAAWLKQWPEVPDYFKYVANGVEEHGWFKDPISGFVRGGLGFTDGCNTRFQHRASAMSKAAMFEASRRCYSVRKSALYGSRVVAFIHDELLAEVPIARAHEAAHELAQVMLDAGKHFAPDVKSKAEPALMERWYKGAEAVFENGKLVPWRPAPKKEAA
jgi:DNA polymerase I